MLVPTTSGVYPDVMVVVRKKVDSTGPGVVAERTGPQPVAGHGSVKIMVPVETEPVVPIGTVKISVVTMLPEGGVVSSTG